MHDLQVLVTVPKLTALEARGAGSVHVRELQGDRFELDLSGVSDAKLTGRLNTFALHLSGAGDVDARELQTERAEVDVSGVGDAELGVAKELEVRISGAGKVRYHGSPTVVKNISGVGSLEAVD